MQMKPNIERINRPHEQARNSYNAMSRWYDLFTSSERQFTDIGVQMLDVQGNESILEIGCGTGHALTEFASKSKQVFAVDIAEKMLKNARRKNAANKIGFCQADGLSLPFPADQIDVIFISFTLELFDTPEIPSVLEECKRVLKLNGRIGIVSLAKQDRTSVRIYEWFHRQMPVIVDCRPIYLQNMLVDAQFHVQKSSIETMWGLPVEIVIAEKRS